MLGRPSFPGSGEKQVDTLSSVPPVAPVYPCPRKPQVLVLSPSSWVLPAQPRLCFSPALCRKPVNMTKATVNYRQEKTHMMSAVDRSFTDQSTLQEDERLGLSFMDTHGYSPRGECSAPAFPWLLT